MHRIRIALLVVSSLVGAAANAAPVCDVALSQPAYIENEVVRISTLHFANQSASPLPVRLRLQLTIPNGIVINVIDAGASGSIVLPAGFDRLLSPVQMFPVSAQQPRGTYVLRCALEDPATGAVLAEDTASFDLPHFPDRYPVLLESGFDSSNPDATSAPMTVVAFEEFGPQVAEATASSCEEWTAEAPVILSRDRDLATFQRIDVETPGCAPSVVEDAISLGPLGTLPYKITVTSASLHYQPFGAAIRPEGTFADDQPAMFHLVGTVEIQGHTVPFDVLSPAENDVADGGQPSGTFASVAGSDDIALEHLRLRAVTSDVPGNRPPALLDTLVNGVPVALRIGGRFAGALGSDVATPVPVP
jgi:hypothetical protein